jgi:D-threonate/D-erythronate kinase
MTQDTATLRLLADDLTGALDSAARFVTAAAPIPVIWQANAAVGSVAMDSGTRDVPRALAASQLQPFIPKLAAGELSFKKIDSLLRGHVALELAACLAAFDHCILAPAFPFQGRITRQGRQLRRDGDTWRDTGVDLQVELRRYGIAVPVCDAETEQDLDRIVREGRRLDGRVLWCGTGGLAGALTGHRLVPRPTLVPPILAAIGSDHPVSRAQIDAVPRALRGSVIVCDLPSHMDRRIARRRIGEDFVRFLTRGPRPGTLFVSGGETLRDLCVNLGVTHLEVDGELEPGVPTFLMRGGSWDGQRLVSKSGAFGGSNFLADLLEEIR